MQVFIGPAGIPLALKGKSTLEALDYISKIGLNALEIEFVRKIYLKERDAKILGKKAEELGIRLSIHAPYFLNLASEREVVVKRSKGLILKSLEIGSAMNAECVVIHAGYYWKKGKEETFQKIKEGIEDILERFSGNTKLAIETMAKKGQFGDLDEVIKLCKEVNDKRVVPLIDFAHIYARNNGFIDYSEIFDKVKVMNLQHINSHFSNVKYNINTKRFQDIHVPINNHPPVEPLLKEIVKRAVNITIICESPLLERDALKIKEKLTKILAIRR